MYERYRYVRGPKNPNYIAEWVSFLEMYSSR